MTVFCSYQRGHMRVASGKMERKRLVQRGRLCGERGEQRHRPRSVWSGVYTDEQAKRGEAVSNKLCTSCHGPDLSGGEAGPTLVGLEFIGNWNNLTVADFFDRVHATMPADAPGTMTPQQTSDVIAYVFKLNKFPAGKTELPTDIAVLKGIKIEGAQPAK